MDTILALIKIITCILYIYVQFINVFKKIGTYI